MEHASSLRLQSGSPSTSAPPSAIHFCSNCEKPFAQESSRNRHRRYCGSRVRKRPRSCHACNTAKTKCSFGTPCARCDKRGIACIYETSTKMAAEMLFPWAAAPTSSPRHLQTSHVQQGNMDPFLGADLALERWSDSHITQDLVLDDPYDLSVDIFQPYHGANAQVVVDAPVDPYSDADEQSHSWCTWMRRDLALSAVATASVAKRDGSALDTYRLDVPNSHRNADVVIQALRAFPTMMLRRETFPWFIHPQSQFLIDSTAIDLPETLSNCMGIAQVFASYTSETRHFLWRTIRAEHHRLKKEMWQMSKFELLLAIQVCMIYLIMFILRSPPEHEEQGLDFPNTLHELYILLKTSCGSAGCQGGVQNLTMKWTEWIFSESQRRLASLWFLFGCVVCVKTGKVYDVSQSYRAIKLPSSKYLWEATTEFAWETEYAASRSLQLRGLVTLGDLIDAQQSQSNASSAHILDQWNAGIDNLGSLLNLVGGMV